MNKSKKIKKWKNETHTKKCEYAKSKMKKRETDP